MVGCPLVCAVLPLALIALLLWRQQHAPAYPVCHDALAASGAHTRVSASRAALVLMRSLPQQGCLTRARSARRATLVDQASRT